jgi:hypothetical protein
MKVGRQGEEEDKKKEAREHQQQWKSTLVGVEVAILRCI